MKKQTIQKKKLTLQKETLTDLRQVSGGSVWNDTVYHPPANSSRCTDGSGSYA